MKWIWYIHTEIRNKNGLICHEKQKFGLETVLPITHTGYVINFFSDPRFINSFWVLKRWSITKTLYDMIQFWFQVSQSILLLLYVGTNSRKAEITKLIVFGITQPGVEYTQYWSMHIITPHSTDGGKLKSHLWIVGSIFAMYSLSKCLIQHWFWQCRNMKY